MQGYTTEHPSAGGNLMIPLTKTKKFCGAIAFALVACCSLAWLGAVERAWQTGTWKDVQVKRATARGNRHLAQTLRTFFRGRVGGRFAAALPRLERVQRQDHEKIDGGRNQHEGEQRVEEIADQKSAAIGRQRDGGKIRLAHQ